MAKHTAGLEDALRQQLKFRVLEDSPKVAESISIVDSCCKPVSAWPQSCEWTQASFIPGWAPLSHVQGQDTELGVSEAESLPCSLVLAQPAVARTLQLLSPPHCLFPPRLSWVVFPWGSRYQFAEQKHAQAVQGWHELRGSGIVFNSIFCPCAPASFIGWEHCYWILPYRRKCWLPRDMAAGLF